MKMIGLMLEIWNDVRMGGVCVSVSMCVPKEKDSLGNFISFPVFIEMSHAI